MFFVMSIFYYGGVSVETSNRCCLFDKRHYKSYYKPIAVGQFRHGSGMHGQFIFLGQFRVSIEFASS